MEKEGNDGKPLNKIANTGYQKNVQRNDRHHLTRRNKKRKSTCNERPNQLFRTFPFSEGRNRQPLSPSIWEPFPEKEDIHQDNETKTNEKQARKNIEHLLDDLRDLFFKKIQALLWKSHFFMHSEGNRKIIVQAGTKILNHRSPRAVEMKRYACGCRQHPSRDSRH